MSYILNGTTIRSPSDFEEDNSSQSAVNRTLAGTNTEDIFGSNKRMWTLNYQNVNATDYAAIKSLYTTYLTSGTAQSWHVTETNYTVASTSVLVHLGKRSFTIKGNDYLSNFTLTLTEV